MTYLHVQTVVEARKAVLDIRNVSVKSLPSTSLWRLSEANPLHIPPPFLEVLHLQLIAPRLNVNWTKSQTSFLLMVALLIFFLSLSLAFSFARAAAAIVTTYCRVWGEMDVDDFRKHSLANSVNARCPHSSPDHNGLSNNLQYLHH